MTQKEKYTFKKILYFIFFPFSPFKNEPLYFKYARRFLRILNFVLFLMLIFVIYLQNTNSKYFATVAGSMVLVMIFYAVLNRIYLQQEKELQKYTKENIKNKLFR